MSPWRLLKCYESPAFAWGKSWGRVGRWVSRNRGQCAGRGSERKTEFISKINKHNWYGFVRMALAVLPRLTKLPEMPKSFCVSVTVPVWGITYIDAFRLLLGCLWLSFIGMSLMKHRRGPRKEQIKQAVTKVYMSNHCSVTFSSSLNGR